MNDLPPLSGAILISNPRKDTPMAVQRHNPRITKWPRFIAAAKRRGYKYGTAAQRRRVANAWKKYKNKGAFGVAMDKVLKPKKKRKAPAKRRASTTRKRKLSAWQRFLKRVAGRGYSMAQKKRMYKRMKSSAKPMRKRKTTKRKSTRRSRGAGRTIRARKPRSVGSQLSAAEKRARRKAAARKAARTRAKNKRQAKMRRLRKTYTPRQIAMMRRAGSPVWAQANGLALKNQGIVGGYFRSWSDYTAASVTGLGVGAATHGALFASGWAPMILTRAEEVPVVGAALSWPLPVVDRSVTSLAPHTLIGGVALATTGILSWCCTRVAVVPPAVNAFLVNLGVSAAATGALFDLYNLSAEYVAPLVPQPAQDDILGALALDNVSALGGLALDNVSALGGLALDNVSALGGLALDNFGDGFAYQTAPLQASNVGDYGQCSMGDAFYSGADFSSAEGQCIMNGRETFFGQFGTPSYRPKSDPHSASHYAGQPGHRWGWLIQTCGWPKAQQIAALPPRKRLKVIAEMRKAAMAAFQRETLLSRASAVEAATPAPESLLPAAGSVSGGASAPGGPAGAYGDPALFMA